MSFTYVTSRRVITVDAPTSFNIFNISGTIPIPGEEDKESVLVKCTLKSISDRFKINCSISRPNSFTVLLAMRIPFSFKIGAGIVASQQSIFKISRNGKFRNFIVSTVANISADILAVSIETLMSIS